MWKLKKKKKGKKPKNKNKTEQLTDTENRLVVARWGWWTVGEMGEGGINFKRGKKKLNMEQAQQNPFESEKKSELSA